MTDEELSASISTLTAEAEENRKRRKLLTWALGILGGGGVLSFGGYEMVIKPTKVEPAEVQETVTKEAKSIERKVKVNSAKVERLGEIAIDQQELTVKTADYIGAKIDAAHPKTADAVEKPPELQEAETAVRSRAREAAAGELFKDIDTALSDP